MTQSADAIAWRVRRTMIAQYLPATLTIAALGAWVMLAPAYALVSVLSCTIGAILFEQSARQQLALARIGRTALAVVGEVHRQGMRYDNPYVTFHFTTDAGEVVEGTCPTSEIDRLVMTTGARIEVLYEPTNPK